MLFPSLILLILATSVLSAVLGMVGGVILMGVFASLLAVQTAMVLHGSVQLAANGSRALILYRSVQWGAVGRVAVGALAGFGLFALLAFAPPRWLVLTSLGLVPYIGFALARYGRPLDITKPHLAYGCGVLMAFTSLLAGVSGPLQDIFFTHTKLNRHQVVATKAMMQAFGHSLKIAYYGGVLVLAQGGGAPLAQLPAWFLPTALAVAFIGTWGGTRVLARIKEQQFFRWTRATVLAVGAASLVRAAWEFVPQ